VTPPRPPLAPPPAWCDEGLRSGADGLPVRRRGLQGYHRVQDAGDARGAPEPLDAAAARLHAARTHLLQAYGAIRRYPRDPRWGRIDGNPEARRAMELARLNLRMARDHLRRAAAIAAIGDSPAHDGQADSDSRPSSLLARLCRGRAP
jgi:hypothetical protein